MYRHCHCRACSRSQAWERGCCMPGPSLAGLLETSKKAPQCMYKARGLSDDIQNGGVHFQSGSEHSLDSELKSVHRAKGRVEGFPLPYHCCSQSWEGCTSVCTDIWVADKVHFQFLQPSWATDTLTHLLRFSHWLLLNQQSTDSTSPFPFIVQQQGHSAARIIQSDLILTWCLNYKNSSLGLEFSEMFV